MRYIYFFLSFIILSSACITERCPPDVDLGAMLISEESKLFLSYENVTGLIFENEDADQIILHSEVGLIDSFWSNCVAKPCAIALVDETCETLDLEIDQIEFENDSLKLIIRLLWRDADFLDDEREENFFETIQTIFMVDDELLETSFISNPLEENLDSIFLDLKPDTLNNYQLIDSIYPQVIAKDDFVWYVENIGIVGFRLFDSVYELKEIIN